VLNDPDEFFMREALEEAEKALLAEEVPVGAVAVYEGKIISRAHNLVESLKDASAHAELLCLRSAAEYMGGWRLLGVTLYTTLEPCTLCAGSAFAFRVDRVVWGAPDIRQGADGSFLPILSAPHPIHKLEVKGNVLEKESAFLLRGFFKKKRDKKDGTTI
jgi:tRNA(adenine34) deaminase